jgi:Arc/MetJ family transcription regulator
VELTAFFADNRIEAERFDHPPVTTVEESERLERSQERIGRPRKSCRISADSLCGTMCKEVHMATNLALDPALVERALELSGETTKRAAVTRALQEFIARRSQRRLVELMGKLEWDDAFDYKSERSRH